DVINITRSPVRLPASTFRSGILSVLASVDVGQASPVFTVSSNDYGVALKVSHVDASNTPFDEVSGDIRTMLSQQEERNRLSSYESSLRAKASVVINDEELFASTAASQDKSQSADILPIMSIEEEEEIDEPESEDEAIEDEPEEEEPEESAEPVAASEDKTAETPAPVVTVSEDEPAETPAPVAVSEDTTAETPEPVTVSEDTTAETPEPVTVSEDTPAETPAPVEPVTEAETPEPVATASEDTTAVAEAPSAEEAPAPVEQSADTETPAPIEALSEDTPAVTVTEASPDIQQ
ncbi:MAG: hypothetical protein IJG37_06075, partial [Synergistaceae bacterium]|nr:hypothetical protein [Synergistaceae bacterium]